MSLHLLADTHRRNVADLSAIADNDLRILFRQHTDATKARDALLVALPRLATIYGAAASTLAADWYDDLRADARVRGRFTVNPAAPVGPERTDILARWGVEPLFSATPDPTQALARISGGVQQIIADCSRLTISDAAIEDPRATGWVRETFDCCDFCQDLAAGPFTEAGAEFESHTNCKCVAAPAF